MNIYILVGLLTLVVQCKSQSIKGPRFYTVPYDYEDPQEPVKEEDDSETPILRRNDRVPPLVIRRVPSEETHPQTENYPYILPQVPRSRFRIITSNKKSPSVEQFLKEVTPTTKTAYNLRYSGQPRSNSNKQAVEESRSVLKQSPFQYVLQPDYEQKPSPQEPEQVVYPKPQILRRPQHSEILSTNLLAHQNALIADQNPGSYEQQHTQQLQKLQQVQRFINSANDGPEPSRSAIYVSQKIPKKPVARKVNKPKPAHANEDDLDYYIRLQQYQQQQQLLQQQSQQQKTVQEPKQPAPVQYQARAPTSDVQYEEQQDQQYVKYQDALHYQQPQPVPLKYRKPVKPKDSVQQLNYQPRPIGRYQEEIKYEQTPKQVIPVEEQQPQQYRYIQKPVPEPVEQTYHQQSSENDEAEYRKITEDALERYKAALAKYQETINNNRDVETAQQRQVVYQQPDTSQQEYTQQSQYSEQNYPVAQEAEQPVKIYKAADLEQALRNRAAARVPAPNSVNYRQNLRTSNVRYYRNLRGRPSVVYTSNE